MDSKKVFKLVDGQAGIANDRGHGVGVDWIVAGNHNLQRAL